MSKPLQMPGALNFLDPRWMNDPKALVGELARFQAQGVKVEHQLVINSYTMFAAMEMCPGMAAENYARAAGLEGEALQKALEEAEKTAQEGLTMLDPNWKPRRTHPRS